MKSVARNNQWCWKMKVSLPSLMQCLMSLSLEKAACLKFTGYPSITQNTILLKSQICRHTQNLKKFQIEICLLSRARHFINYIYIYFIFFYSATVVRHQHLWLITIQNCLTQLLLKPDGSKLKQFCPQRKALNAVLLFSMLFLFLY